MQKKPIFRNANRPTIIAHRGASALYRENTIAAFDAAIDMGADGIELDIRRSRDGVILVHHDARLRGMDRLISDMTFDDAARAARKLDYEIPTLADVVNLCAGRAVVDVELKETGYEAAVATEVVSRIGPGDAVFTSFHDISVAALKEYAPTYKAGLLLGHNLFSPGLREKRPYLPMRRLLRSRADFVAPHWQLLRLGLMRRWHRIGYPLAVWTVNRRRHAERLAARGVDLIITDYPDRMLHLKRR